MSVRDELLAALDEYGKLVPTMRLGQLVHAIATSARGSGVEAVYDVEDEELLAACKRLAAQRRNASLSKSHG